MEKQQLLENYLKKRSDEAFECIVQAHGALVFNVALRTTRNQTLAEEVTQEVFIILAKKASSIQEPHKLPSWLHRTTLYCAANLNRKEAKRKHTMKAYAQDRSQKIDSPQIAGGEWKDVMTLLDQTINKLSSGDRKLILLRFYEDCSLKEISRIMGKSEGTSRKQMSRALEKLSRLIGKKGVPISVTALGTGLGAHLSPLPLPASKISQFASIANTSAGAALTTSTIAIMSGYKLTVALATVAALLPIGMQWQENLKNADLPQEHAQPSLQTASRSPRPLHRKSNDIARTQEELQVVLKEILVLENPTRRRIGIGNFMMNLRKDELQSTLSLLQKLPPQLILNQDVELWRGLFRRWAKIDPTTAVEIAAKFETTKPGRHAMYGIVEGWVEADPPALDIYLNDLPATDLRKSLMRHRWKHHARQDFEDAAGMAMKIEDAAERAKTMHLIMEVASRKNPLAGLKQLEGYEEGIDKQRWMTELLTNLSKDQPADAFTKAQKMTVGDHRKQVLAPVMRNWAATDPDQALTTLLSLPNDTRHEGIFKSFGEGLSDFNRIEDILGQLDNGKEKSVLLSGFVNDFAYHSSEKYQQLTPQHIPRLLSLVENLPSGRFQSKAAWDIAIGWSTFDNDAAIHWVRQRQYWPKELKDKFVHHYKE